MNIKLLLTVSSLIYLLSGCRDYLDLVPEKDIQTVETIFETKKGAEKFEITCYYGLDISLGLNSPVTNPGFTAGGEFTASEYLRYDKGMYADGASYLPYLAISDGLQNTNKPYYDQWNMGDGSVYGSIRYCNIFINNVMKVNDMTISEKREWKAEVEALKAFYYFELLKLYGPIVLVPENLEVNEPTEVLQQPRSHVDSCFSAIVKLLDDAIPYLRRKDDMPYISLAYFNKEAAAFLKAKVLLYAASPLFNGNEWYGNFTNRDGAPLFSTQYDANKWKRAAKAIDEAIAICEEGGVKLTQGYTGKKSRKLNTIKDIEQSVIYSNWKGDEWVFLRKEPYGIYHLIFPRFNSQHSLYYSTVNGSLGTNIRMAELYYTDNGLPIDKDNTWSYAQRYRLSKEINNEYKDVVPFDQEVLNLHLRREPRFYASIGADRTCWEIGNDKYHVIYPYRGEDFGTESRILNRQIGQNISGYWVKKHTEGDAKPPYFKRSCSAVMRMAELYLMQAETWNEIEGPTEKVFNAIDKVRERAGIPKMREAWRQFSNEPEKITNKEGLRDEIRRERMIELAFEGHIYWDLKRWKIAHNYLNEPHYGWNVLGEDARTFYNNFENPIPVWTKVQFIAPRDYFWPIKSEEIMISNIVQNPGW